MFFEKWTGLIDQGSNIGVVYMDFIKSFDKDPYGRLMKNRNIQNNRRRIELD